MGEQEENNLQKEESAIEDKNNEDLQKEQTEAGEQNPSNDSAKQEEQEERRRAEDLEEDDYFPSRDSIEIPKSPSEFLYLKFVKSGVFGEITEEGEFVKFFLNRGLILTSPELASLCGDYLAFPFRYEVLRERITAVVALTGAGARYLNEVARSLFCYRSILPRTYCAEDAEFSENADGIKSGNVLVIEDVLDIFLIEKFGGIKEIVESGGGCVVGLSSLFYDPAITENKLSKLVVSYFELRKDLWTGIESSPVSRVVLSQKKAAKSKQKLNIKSFFKRKDGK